MAKTVIQETRTIQEEINVEKTIIECFISEFPTSMVTDDRLLLEVNEFDENLKVTADEIPHALQSLVEQKKLERVVAYRLPE